MDSLKTDKIRLAKQGDVFITKTATKTLTSTQVVEKVMNFHFKDLIRAFSTYSSVEISGFGTFKISQSKLRLKLKDKESFKAYLLGKPNEKYNRSEEHLANQIAQLDKDINYLRARLTEHESKFQAYHRRMEESHKSTGTSEGDNRTDQQEQTGDLQGMST